MASTNKTVNYDLSQYIGTDKPTYLGDYNSDMSKIDTQMKTNNDAIVLAKSTADTALENASTAQNTATSANELATTANSTAVSALEKATTNETKISSLHTYTIEEQVVGTWIDGKTIYRKVIDLGSLPNATSKRINHNISNLKDVISLNGFAKDSSTFLPIPYISSFTGYDQYQIGFDYTNATTIGVTTGINRTSFTGFAIIEYTKTVD